MLLHIFCLKLTLTLNISHLITLKTNLISIIRLSKYEYAFNIQSIIRYLFHYYFPEMEVSTGRKFINKLLTFINDFL